MNDKSPTTFRVVLTFVYTPEDADEMADWIMEATNDLKAQGAQEVLATILEENSTKS